MDAPEFSRRALLKAAGGIALSAAATSRPSAAEAAPAGAGELGPLNPSQRRVGAFQVRRDAAAAYLQDNVRGQSGNGDEDRYPDRRANFFKGLPQNHLGEVDGYAYERLLAALDSGDPGDFEAIPLSPSAKRALVNPQAAFAYEMTGVDSHGTDLVPPPAFASAEAAAEIGEVYWLSLCRDIPFRDYDTNGNIAAAVADLNRFSQTVGPKVNGRVTPWTVFRGETPGDLIGPYVSQFLWHNVPYGPSTLVQRYDVPLPGVDFVTGYDEWIAIEQGAHPLASLSHPGTPRYISDLRALSHYVHYDVVFQAFLNAALIALGYGRDALSAADPYRGSANQSGFVTFGASHALDLVTKAARVGLEGAWFHKWLVHRRLRPEVMGGRIEIQRSSIKDYGISREILASEAISRVVAANGNALLPQAYPEGSPLHPAYPAGHAVLAGACATVLKAFFDEEFIIPDAVQASADGQALDAWHGADLTLGHEIDKLSSNIGVGRCAGGIHYRFDNRGLAVGEQQAIGMLRDYSITYNEEFAGFTLTTFSGARVRIASGEVLPG